MLHHALLSHLHAAALRSYVICTHLFRTAAGDLRYRVDHMAYKDHVCFAAVCRSSFLLALYGLLGMFAFSKLPWLIYFMGHR